MDNKIFLYLRYNIEICNIFTKKNCNMKRLSVIIILSILGFGIILSSCNPKDTHGPKIYLLDAHGKIIPPGLGDTVVLLYTKFIDPGVRVEDNLSKSEEIIVESNVADILPVTSDGYLKRTGEYEITYTATDAARNVSTKKRKIRIANISEAFAGSYITRRTSQFVNNDTSYKSNVVVDASKPGRLRFPKVYAHTWDGRKVYYRVNADLWNPGMSTTADPSICYMGTASSPTIPFFRNLTYQQGIDTILTFRYLRIDAQNYLDTTGNENYKIYIAGVQDINGVPLSRIEYIGNSKTIARIVLELNVTKNGIYTDRVTETYILE